MDIFHLSQLLEHPDWSRVRYNEFLRYPALSMGIYTLPASATDPQKPHREDEVYYVVGGRGMIRVGTEDQPVEAGAVVYVAKEVEHRFHSIERDLTVLVFFAPAESAGGS